MPRTIDQARKAQAREQKRVQGIATDQVRRDGYVRSPGFEPAARAGTRYTPENLRPQPAGSGRMSGEADTDEVRRRTKKGVVIDNSVFGR